MQTRDWLIPLAAVLLGGGLLAAIRGLFTVGPERGRTLAEEESLAVTTLRSALAELRELRAEDRARYLTQADRLAIVLDELTTARGELADARNEIDRLRAVLRAWEHQRTERREEGEPA